MYEFEELVLRIDNYIQGFYQGNYLVLRNLAYLSIAKVKLVNCRFGCNEGSQSNEGSR